MKTIILVLMMSCLYFAQDNRSYIDFTLLGSWGESQEESALAKGFGETQFLWKRNFSKQPELGYGVAFNIKLSNSFSFKPFFNYWQTSFSQDGFTKHQTNIEDLTQLSGEDKTYIIGGRLRFYLD